MAKLLKLVSKPAFLAAGCVATLTQWVRKPLLITMAAVVIAGAPAIQGLQAPPPRPGVTVRDPGSATRPVPVGTATISGTVVVAGSGTPGRRARVTLSGSDVGPSRTTVADEHGRFTFAALPAGKYNLTASKPGHINAVHGQLRPGRPGTPIQLGEGAKFQAQLHLTRGGVLTGTVLDEDGDPIPGTQIRALRYVLQNGERTLQQSGGGSTDDRGIYRIFGLQPGEYVVGATPRNVDGPPALQMLRGDIEQLRQKVQEASATNEVQGRAIAARLAAMQAAAAEVPEEATGYAPIYYPGTTVLAQAGSIPIGPGEERGGLDFQLQRVPVARIEGLVVSTAGQPVQNIQVSLFDLNPAAPRIGGNSARVDNEGRFTFSNVAPGQYRISARAMAGERGGRGQVRNAPSEQQVRLWAALDVAVDGRNISNVALTLQNGVSASGRVVFQGTSLPAPTDLTRLRITATNADTETGSRELGGTVAGRAEASGRFTLAGLTPGRYRLTAGGAPQGWTLESAVIDGQDSLDFPFEVKAGQNVPSATITFSDQRSELSGTLTDGRGQPAPGYTLIVFPSDQRYWLPQSRRIRTTRPATDGGYTFGVLPPGEYRIAPVVDAEPGSWFDPGFLQQLEATALRVTVLEGEKKVQNVRIAGGG